MTTAALGSVCLFCSASDAVPESARAAARNFGRSCAARRLRLVFGGGTRGLMGEAALACADAGGDVVGVIPRLLLSRERTGRDVGTLHVVETLSERKQAMADLADCFVCLPGGVGTLDELIEMITWYDLGISRKPVFLCNVDGFWSPLLATFDAWKAYGVIRPHVVGAWRVGANVADTLDLVAAHLASSGAAAASPPPR
jgi:uncharacterized protein (TIGR00730 family)